MSTGCGIDYVSNVTIAGINRSSTCDNLSGSKWVQLLQHPDRHTDRRRCQPAILVSIGGDLESAAAWIDFNQDGTFTTDENLFNGYAGTNPATYSGTFNVPGLAVIGTTRMRVRCTYAGSPGVGRSLPVAAPLGATEDYLVRIKRRFGLCWSTHPRQYDFRPLHVPQ
ncbi:MAG: hypothetical protein IPG69_02955 [Flavobacteriales bacterium]|nr:hypothetical protein [Flavobacteriales bacterium]